MNLRDWRAFAAKTKTEQGAIVASEIPMSRSLIDDPEFPLQQWLADEAVRAARAFYDRDDCEYTYLSPAEYPYTQGPCAYRTTPGDLPPGTVLFYARTCVRRIP